MHLCQHSPPPGYGLVDDLKNIFSMQISLGNGVELYLHVSSSLAGSSRSFGSRTGASGARPPVCKFLLHNTHIPGTLIVVNMQRVQYEFYSLL